MTLATTIISLMFWLLYYQNPNHHVLRSITITTTVIAIGVWFSSNLLQHNVDLLYNTLFIFLWQLSILLYTGLVVDSMYEIIAQKRLFRKWQLALIAVIVGIFSHITTSILFPSIYFLVAVGMLVYLFTKFRTNINGANEYLFRGAMVTFLVAVLILSFEVLQVTANAHIHSILMASF